MTDIFDAAVIGAGPAGLVAALALHTAGAKVALIGPIPDEDERTSALLAGSMRLLERIGVGREVEALAAPLRIMRIIDGTHRLIRAPEVAFEAGEIGLAAFGCNIANRDLTRILGRAVETRGIAVQRERAERFRFGEAVAESDLAGGATIRARLLVAADGRRSASREAASIAVRTWSYPQTAVVANIRHSADHRDTSSEFHTETGPFTMVPVGPGRSAVVAIVKPGEALAMMAMSDEALARDFERRGHHLLGRIAIDGARQIWPMSGLIARQIAGRRIALISEAAHAFPPIGAQGLNLGLRDIATLAEVVGTAVKTGADCGDAAVLDRYAARRRLDVGSRTLGVDMLNRSLLTGFLPVQMARMIGLNLARLVPPLRKALMRQGLGAG